MSKDKYQFFNVVSESEEEAVIEIYGTIGGWDWEEWKEINTIKTITEELNRIKSLNSKKILIKINSLGGDCDSALTIYDALKDHKAKITTQANGYIASAATIIFMAGEERKVSKNSLFLVHKCSSWAWGNENELEATLDMQRKTNERILSIYADGCTKSKEEISALMEENNGTGKWIAADEVMDYGFSTVIYNETKKAAAIDPRAFKAFRYPPLPAGYDVEPEDKEAGMIAKILKEMREFFSQNNKSITHKNQKEMKKLSVIFPLIFALFAFKTDEDYDSEKGRSFSDDELKSLEAQLAENDTLKAKFEAEKKELNDKLTAMKTSRDELQAKLDKSHNLETTGNPIGGDVKNQNSYLQAQKEDDFYNSIAKEHGIKFE